MASLLLALLAEGIPPALSLKRLRVIDNDAVKKLVAVIDESFVLRAAILVKLVIGHGLEVQCRRVTETMIRDGTIFCLCRLANTSVGYVVQCQQFFEFGFKEGHLIGSHVFF